MKSFSKNSIKIGLSTILLSTLSFADTSNAKKILDAKCIACHTKSETGELSRISEQRKTPEGWFMTLTRMKSHGLLLSDKEMQSVVKYLADTQGITPEESKSFRYILEQKPNTQEATHDPLFTDMCIRCHSAARVGLQRRTLNEWDNLIDFHLGRFPTTEYHALSRDREWFGIAKKEIVPFLAKEYKLDTKQWKKWVKDVSNKPLAKQWRVYGHTLGAGDFSANLKLKEVSKDNYEVSLEGSYLDGRPLQGVGKAIVYSGYEYRATLKIDDISYKQVFTLYDNKLEGRMFETRHPEEGSVVKGVSTNIQNPTILAVLPKAIKAGTTNIVTIVGSNLNKKIKLPSDLKLEKIISKSSQKVKILVSSSLKTNTKKSKLSIGQTSTDFVVYKEIDGLKISPSYAIARVGDGGGFMPKQHSVFEAFGYAKGKDGKLGTADDIELGIVDTSWRVEPFDETAKKDEDIKYAGRIDSLSGRFTPSFAGPNPKRKFSTNNAGNLKVIATLKNSEKKVEAQSHLIVTVQKWVNPPIN